MVVKPEVARRQLDAEQPDVRPRPSPEPGPRPEPPPGDESDPAPAAQPTRFHGTVQLDTMRAGRNASQIADEVVAHLAGLPRAKVTVTLEIAAEIPEGASKNVVRTVTENSQTLRFTSHGFERD